MNPIHLYLDVIIKTRNAATVRNKAMIELAMQYQRKRWLPFLTFNPIKRVKKLIGMVITALSITTPYQSPPRPAVSMVPCNIKLLKSTAAIPDIRAIICQIIAPGVGIVLEAGIAPTTVDTGLLHFGQFAESWSISVPQTEQNTLACNSAWIGMAVIPES